MVTPTAVPVNVTTLVEVLYEVTVPIPELSIPVTANWSPVLIPTTESRVTVETPAFTVAVTVLVLVTSPMLKMESLTVTLFELTVVVVPSTCRSPLTITVPSLLKPSGYGSI